MRVYHDDEWGVPSRDDAHLFEMLVLEGAQAGLSWSIVLSNARATAGPSKGSITSASPATATTGWPPSWPTRASCATASGGLRVTNAQAFLAVRDDFGTFSDYLWEWWRTPLVNNPGSWGICHQHGTVGPPE